MGRTVLHYCRTPLPHAHSLWTSAITEGQHVDATGLHWTKSKSTCFVHPCSSSIRCYRPVTPPPRSLVLTAPLAVCVLIGSPSSHGAGGVGSLKKARRECRRHSSLVSSALKMEAACSAETSVNSYETLNWLRGQSFAWEAKGSSPRQGNSCRPVTWPAYEGMPQ